MKSSLAFIALSLAVSTFAHEHGVHHEKRMQPGVPQTPKLDLRPLEWGDVNFVHTTDTHGWLEGHIKEENYNADIGDFYSFAKHMKELAIKKKKDLFVIDTGDLHDGNGLSDVTSPDGQITDPVITDIDYDILTIGNHELYVNNITVDVYKNFAPKWKGKYLTSNVQIIDPDTNNATYIGEQYRYFKGRFGTRVLAFGFLYDFTGNGNVSVITPVEKSVAQPWFTDALNKYEVDIYVVTGHSVVRGSEFEAVFKAIRAVKPTTPIAFLGGHSHIRDFKVFDGRAAGIESGRYLETVGWFSIDGIKPNKTGHGAEVHDTTTPGNLTFNRRYLDTNRPTYEFHSGRKSSHRFDTTKGKWITNYITKERKALNTSFLYGCAPHDYYLNRVPADNEYSIYNLLTTEILPKTITNPSRTNPAWIVINSGSQRFDLYKGPFTLDDTYIVSPFSDYFLYFADIPYSVVSQLLGKLDNSGFSKRSTSSIHPAIPLAAHHSANVTETFGYVTTDDLGTGGDDTVHLPIPYVNVANYIATPLPTNPTPGPNDLFDVVCLDFFASTLTSILKKLMTTTPPTPIPYTNLSINTMYPVFASNNWNKTC